MRIFSDFHHGGLYRSLVSLFCGRLGHELYIPNLLEDTEKVKWLSDQSCWGTCHNDFWDRIGKYPNQLEWSPHGLITYEEFMDTHFDLLIATRQESHRRIVDLSNIHPSKPALAYQNGNDGCIPVDYDLYPNILSSTELFFRHAQLHGANALLYCQELGHQYCSDEFQPVTESNLKNIGCFVNNIESFNAPFKWNRDNFYGGCPHCNVPVSSFVPAYPDVSPFAQWLAVSKILTSEGYTFVSYGHQNVNGWVDEVDIPYRYRDCALTWWIKNYEGYGHSLLQSVALGRPVIIPEKFFRYRTANRFLIPETTCFEWDWTVDQIVDKILEVTSSVDTINHYAESCFRTARALFDWDHEAWKVSRWLERIR